MFAKEIEYDLGKEAWKYRGRTKEGGRGTLRKSNLLVDCYFETWKIRKPLGDTAPNRGADEYLDNDQIPWKGRGGETKRANEANMRRSPSNRANDISRGFAANPGIKFLFDSRPDITAQPATSPSPSLIDWRNTPMDGSTLEAFLFFFFSGGRGIFFFFIILYALSRIFDKSRKLLCLIYNICIFEIFNVILFILFFCALCERYRLEFLIDRFDR